MLRAIFHQSPRTDTGRLAEALKLMHAYADGVSRPIADAGKIAQKEFRFVLWTRSMITTLDELEQSIYCAEMYMKRIQYDSLEQMSEEEAADYRRHLYYYRNAVLRTFSTLDKLGSFINERYALGTERIKQRYSYYTVLRRMHEMIREEKLSQQLQVIKQKYQDPMHNLRIMRNHEVHAMNGEMLDDEGHIRCYSDDCYEKIEDLTINMSVLQLGFVMVCESVITVYKYLQLQSQNRHGRRS